MYLISLKNYKITQKNRSQMGNNKTKQIKRKKKKTQLDKKVIVVKLFIPTIIKFFLKIFLLI